ncbi:MAG: 3-hydroxyacyl-CoA dehydrogenase family protein [Streptomycetales bacterium]
MGRKVAKIGVVGLGTMGAGIAEVLARAGLQVVGVEVADEALTRGRGHIGRSSGRAVQRGRLTEDESRALLGRIAFTTALDDLGDADLVIEAAPERMEVKRELLGRLDAVCRAETILATNTSSLSVTEIAAATGRPGQVVGMHFFNPAPVMKLVEVVRTVVSDPEAVAAVVALAERIGKRPVTCRDRAGFIANALLFGYLNRAVSMHEKGHATRDDIDAAMKLGAGLPLGPFQLLDLIGLDTACQILETMYGESGDRLHAPAPLLRQTARAGLLGRKSGRGFYCYGEAAGATPGEPAKTPYAGTRDVERVGVVGAGPRADGLAEAFRAAGFGVGQAERGEVAPGGLGGVGLVVAVSDEDPQADRALFQILDQTCPAGTVLATTAVRLPVVVAAAATRRPESVVGLRVFDPVPESKLVEVVRAVSTGDPAVETARAVCDRLGRRAVVCGDRVGRIVDALLVPYLNDAVRMLESRYASADDIAAAMTLGCGYPAGPFTMIDEIGLDTVLATQDAIYRESGEPGLRPAPLLEQLVTAGRPGRGAGASLRDHT